jgi:hypothetical protein
MALDPELVGRPVPARKHPAKDTRIGPDGAKRAPVLGREERECGPPLAWGLEVGVLAEVDAAVGFGGFNGAVEAWGEDGAGVDAGGSAGGSAGGQGEEGDYEKVEIEQHDAGREVSNFSVCEVMWQKLKGASNDSRDKKT